MAKLFKITIAGINELIDTLWNVNESAPADWVEQLRINRYIMECKCAYINATVQCSGN